MSHAASTAEVYRVLCDRIVQHAIPGGARLVERALCEEFEVSRSVVREAIQRLASVALVKVVPEAGATVIEWTESRTIDAFLFREAVETVASEQCAARMNREQIEHLLALADQFRVVWQSKTRDRIARLIRLERAFHGAIIEGSANEFLQRSWEIACLNLHCGLKDDNGIHRDEARQLSVDDHLTIARAIELGDAASAGQAMKHHLQHARQSFVKRSKTETLTELKP